MPEGQDWFSIPFGVAIAASIFVFSSLEWELNAMFAITVFCISLWITTPVPTWYTSLIGIALIGLLFSPDLALEGLKSPAVWLIVLGLLIEQAIKTSGLANRTELWVLSFLPKSALVSGVRTYRLLLLGLCGLGVGFAIVVPSALVHVLIFGPVLVTINNSFSSRQAKVGLFLGPLFTTYFSGTGILTGSLVSPRCGIGVFAEGRCH